MPWRPLDSESRIVTDCDEGTETPGTDREHYPSVRSDERSGIPGNPKLRVNGATKVYKTGSGDLLAIDRC